MDSDYRAGRFTSLYQVTGRLKSGAAFDSQIVNARTKRSAMLIALRKMGPGMNKVAHIEAERVN